MRLLPWSSQSNQSLGYDAEKVRRADIRLMVFRFLRRRKVTHNIREIGNELRLKYKDVARAIYELNLEGAVIKFPYDDAIFIPRTLMPWGLPESVQKRRTS